MAENGLGRAYVRVLKENCDKLGVTIRTLTRVTRVVREEPLAGDVLGVEYTDAKGQVHRIRAVKSVVVASGGFGANPEMRAIHDPRLRNLTTTNHVGATGDLIPLVQDIGGEVTGMDYIQCNPGAPPGRTIRAAFHVYPDYCIMVDEDCKRFVAEDERRDVIREAILSLPNQRGFTLIDSDGQALYQSDPTYVKQTQKCLETGDAWTADTWEALAEKMKVDPKALRASIEEWNALVDSTQEDTLGRKRKTIRKLVKPPFWACYAGMSVHYIMGGLLINTKTQVVDREGKVIPKLHAIGEVAGGIHGTNRLGGNSLCDCFTFGRLTGIWVAEGL